MSFFTYESSFCWNVVIALAHSIWIGCFIGIFVWVANHFLKDRSPNVRYWLNFSALLAFAVLLPIAFFLQAGETLVALDASIGPSVDSSQLNSLGSERKSATPAAKTQSTDPEIKMSIDSATSTANSATSNFWFVVPTWLVRVIAFSYLLGVCLMCIRLSIAIRRSQQTLVTSNAISDPAILQQFERVLDSFSLYFKPAIAESESIVVPMVAGFLRPVVLLPTSIVTGLAPAEIESVLRHELAHLYRYDHVLIVLQRVIESILFFHPVTWYLSRRIHEEREHCCDELAVATGVSRIEYATALLKVAEYALAQPGSESSQPETIAMAADGHRPSKLHGRISRLLVADRAKPATGHKMLLCLVGLLMFSAAWAAGQVLANDDFNDDSQLAVESKDDSDIAAELYAVLEKGRRSVDAVKTAHIQFKLFRKGGLKGTQNPKQCEEIIEKLKPIDTRAKMKTLIESLTEISADGKFTPNNVELHFDQHRTREAIDWAGKTDIHISNPELSLFWNEANYQMNILPAGESSRYQFTKAAFLKSYFPKEKSPFVEAVKAELNASEIQRCDDGFLIQSKPGERVSYAHNELRISETIGQPVYRYVETNPGPRVRYSLNWKSYGNGISFPGMVVELNFTKDDTLGYLSVQLIESAKFNIELPDHLFVMSAPAGANIIRGDEHLGVMQEDVFDVTSAFELKAASKSQPRRDLTPEEKRGALVAKKLYSLKKGEVLKRIGPPFPLAHKYVSQMLGYGPNRRPLEEISRILDFNKDASLSYRFSNKGGVFKVRDLAKQFFQLHPSAIEGDSELLETRLPGDFVIRAGASREDLEAAFKQMLEAEFQKDLAVQTDTVDRPLYMASGTLDLNPANGQGEVDVNAGPNSQAYPKIIQSGNVQDFLCSLSQYINCDVTMDDAINSDDFRWSERYYNLNAYPPKDRYDFRIENVLEIVSRQTGLKFEKRSSPKSILSIRKVAD